GILREERERLRAAGVGLWSGLVEELCQPVFYGVDDAVVAIVFRCVAVRRRVPVVAGEQGVTENASIAEGEREALAPGGITGSSGVADQSDAFAVRMIDPAVGAVEGRERTRGLRAFEVLGWHAARDGCIDEGRHILLSLEPQPFGDAHHEVDAGAIAALRNHDATAAALNIGDQPHCVFGYMRPFQEEARDPQTIIIPLLREAAPLTHHRGPSVGAADEPRFEPLFRGVIALNGHGRRRAGGDGARTDATADVGARV